ALAATTAAAPSDTNLSSQEFERLQGFATVVLNHVSSGLGTDNLPNAAGLPVEPGVFVTVMPDRVQIYDRDVTGLTQGRLAERTVATECVSGCAAAFFDALQQTWLEAAIESTVHAVEIPQRVLFATHSDVPALTLIDLAYAAAETRPVAPPSLHLLVNSARGGLRAQRFYLIPPEGLNLRQGSAALGLTISMSPGRYVVKASDPRYAREHAARSPDELRRLLADIKRRYPGKESVIVVPDAQISVGEMMRAVAAIQAGFPRTVLSAGQDVRTP
ncbi:MAG: hypothetical protein AAF721_38085, partial [Myxococcota bacterium]